MPGHGRLPLDVEDDARQRFLNVKRFPSTATTTSTTTRPMMMMNGSLNGQLSEDEHKEEFTADSSRRRVEGINVNVLL